MSALLDHFDRSVAATPGLSIPGGSAYRMGDSREAAACLAASYEIATLQERLMCGGNVPGTTMRMDASAGMSAADVAVECYRLAASVVWAGRLAGVDQRTAGGGARQRLDAFVPQASQALTDILTGVYKYRFARLPYFEGEILPVGNNGVDPAAEEVVWYESMLLGMPRAGSTYDITTIPMVPGPAATANRIGVVPALIGMNVNFMDERRARTAIRNGKPDFQIEREKVRACRRTLAEFFNAKFAYGDVNLGDDGLHNHPLVPVLPLPVPWSVATPLQIYNALSLMLNVIGNDSNGDLDMIGDITIHLPPTQFDKAKDTPLTSAGTDMILQKFLENNGLRPDQVVKQHVLAASNSEVYTGGPLGLDVDTAIVTYLGDGKDEDLSGEPMFVMTQQVETPFPERNDGLSWTTYFHARGAGLMLPDARRIRLVKGL